MTKTNVVKRKRKSKAVEKKKYEISRQVTRREKQLDVKAERGNYTSTYINNIRYEPAEYTGKYMPHQGKKEMEKRRPKWRENADGKMVAL